MIYFIQEGAGGPIKIGIAESPDRRLDLLQCGNPHDLYLRAVLAGGHADEMELHRRFATGHIRGEWFKPDTEGLSELISAARHEEFWPEDVDRCECCHERPIAFGRRKYCDRCVRRSARPRPIKARFAGRK